MPIVSRVRELAIVEKQNSYTRFDALSKREGFFALSTWRANVIAGPALTLMASPF